MEGEEVYLAFGFNYDDHEIGEVFANETDAEEYCATRRKENELTWEVHPRTLA